MISVKQIGQVHVKATQFLNPSSVELDKTGIRYDRDFAMLEAHDRFISSDKHGSFFPLKFTFNSDDDTLCLDLPDGRQIVGPATGSGEQSDINHAGLRDIHVAEVDGPWGEVLSEYAGRPIRLVRCVSTGAAVDVLPVTILSTGSLRRLAREVGAPVDASRFRTGFILDNEIEHEEDQWEGRHMRIGSAVVKVRTAVPRCGITGFNPNTGVRDQDVMRSLVKYREKTALPDGMLPGFETPGFATFAEVLEPGSVEVGDPVELID